MRTNDWDKSDTVFAAITIIVILIAAILYWAFESPKQMEAQRFEPVVPGCQDYITVPLHKCQEGTTLKITHCRCQKHWVAAKDCLYNIVNVGGMFHTRAIMMILESLSWEPSTAEIEIVLKKSGHYLSGYKLSQALSHAVKSGAVSVTKNTGTNRYSLTGAEPQSMPSSRDYRKPAN